MWSSKIAAFNAAAHNRINVVFTYGGDMVRCAAKRMVARMAAYVRKSKLDGALASEDFFSKLFSGPSRPPTNPIPISWAHPFSFQEYYPALPQPFQTYFPASNQEAAAAYNATPGIDYVILVIDGRMDGGQSYDPDLSKLNNSQLQDWADEVAELYCSFDIVDGIQMDLEVSAAPNDCVSCAAADFSRLVRVRARMHRSPTSPSSPTPASTRHPFWFS